MPATSIIPSTTLGELLLTAPALGQVWERIGVNLVRDEGRTLAELCESHGLESRTVVRWLSALHEARKEVPAACVELMTLAELCDHLENAHRDLHDELKRVDRLTKMLAKEHGAEHPKLLAIRKVFASFQRKFKAHLQRESQHLFPVVRRWAACRNEKRRVRLSFRSPLTRLRREHNHADETLADLRSLVARDALSSSSGEAAQTIADALTGLEHAVHEQIYKENRILFPKTLPMRRELQAGRRDFARCVSVPMQPTLKRKSIQTQHDMGTIS